MIIEDYISFEIAKLLKEKGFDIICDKIYRMDGYLCPLAYGMNIKEERYYLAPTLQMVMKWLREVHNLCIEPYRTACGYLYIISTIPYGSCKHNPKYGGNDANSGQWTSYEKACEAAIKYCLENLI